MNAMQCFRTLFLRPVVQQEAHNLKELEVLASASVRLGKHLLIWVQQKDLLSLTWHPTSVNSMSTYMHVGSGTGGISRVKCRRRRGVFGSLFENYLHSGGSSQFTSIPHAELQL